MGRRAILFDRDGTMCPNTGFVLAPEQLEILPSAAPALALATQGGFQTVLVTNQAAVALGHMTESRLDEIHRRLRAILAKDGARIDGLYWCPHHPAGVVPRYALDCSCRKPRPRMLWRARDEMGIDLVTSWLLGDRLDDLAAGAAAGVRTVLVRTGRGAREQARLGHPGIARPDRIAEDVLEAVTWITAGAACEAAR